MLPAKMCQPEGLSVIRAVAKNDFDAARELLEAELAWLDAYERAIKADEAANTINVARGPGIIQAIDGWRQSRLELRVELHELWASTANLDAFATLKDSLLD